MPLTTGHRTKRRHDKGTVALITARGGSKRLPGKNLLSVGGKPLIAWSIAAALEAPSVGRVILSTDDEEIASVGRHHGAEVPFLRPTELAGDYSSHVDVMLHALHWLEHEGERPDYLLLLQPTSPLRTAEDIEGIIAFAMSRKADSVVAVRRASDHPLLCRRLDHDGRLAEYVMPPEGYLRTQDMPPAYAISGALYLVRPTQLVEARQIVSAKTLGFPMPAERSLDIDDAWDLRLADLVLRERTAIRVEVR